MCNSTDSAGAFSVPLAITATRARNESVVFSASLHAVVDHDGQHAYPEGWGVPPPCQMFLSTTPYVESRGSYSPRIGEQMPTPPDNRSNHTRTLPRTAR